MIAIVTCKMPLIFLERSLYGFTILNKESLQMKFYKKKEKKYSANCLKIMIKVIGWIDYDNFNFGTIEPTDEVIKAKYFYLKNH